MAATQWKGVWLMFIWRNFIFSLPQLEMIALTAAMAITSMLHVIYHLHASNWAGRLIGRCHLKTHDTPGLCLW